MLLKDCIEIKNGKDYSHLADGNIPVYGTGGIFKYVNKYLYDNSALCCILFVLSLISKKEINI